MRVELSCAYGHDDDSNPLLDQSSQIKSHACGVLIVIHSSLTLGQALTVSH